MTVLGTVFLPRLPPERLRGLVEAADGAGLEELWLWEDCFLEGGIATAATALAWSTRLRIGLGLLPVPLRNVALAAMEIATLDRMFPGRLVVGVGHGVQSWMGQVGARVAAPLTLLREYTLALRSLLAGERLTTSGRYVRLDGVALDWPPAEPVPVLVGATGPRTLRLAGEVADGTILKPNTTIDGVGEARELIALGQAAAGRAGQAHRVVMYQHTATGPDAARRLARDLAEWGYDDVGVAGDAATVAAAERRLAEAGVDTVVLEPTPDDPDPEGFIRFAAGEVRPLV